MTKERARNWRKRLSIGFALWWVTIVTVLALGMFGTVAAIMLLSIVGWAVLYLYLAGRTPKPRKLRARRSSNGVAEIECASGMPISGPVLESESRTSDDEWPSTHGTEQIAPWDTSFEYSSPAITVFDLNADGTFNFSGTGIASSGLHDL